jgi:hypothetical protein
LVVIFEYAPPPPPYPAEAPSPLPALPAAPPPITSMVLLALFQLLGTVKLLLQVEVRKVTVAAALA